MMRLVVTMRSAFYPYILTLVVSLIVCDFVVIDDNMSWCAVVLVCGGDIM